MDEVGNEYAAHQGAAAAAQRQAAARGQYTYRAELPSTPFMLHVSASGSDDNPGTPQAPLRSILRASQLARPGTTVVVAPGVYTGGFKTTASGSAGARIYYVSASRWDARIVPPASSVVNAAASAAWDNRGSYVDIVGFEIDGRGVQAGVAWRHGIYNGGSFAAIRHNHVHHLAQNIACTSAGGAAIGVDAYYRGVEAEVSGNLVHDIGPAGCRYVHGIYVSTSGSVRNNVLYRIAAGAIHLWHDARKVTIVNNTVTSSNTGIIVGGGDFYYTPGPNDDTLVANNIVYDNEVGVTEQGLTGLRNRYRNNLVYRNTRYNWRLQNGLTHSATVTADPAFVAYARGGTPDLRLRAASPAIGKGSASHVPALDFAGKPRVGGGPSNNDANSGADIGADIGAYRY